MHIIGGGIVGTLTAFMAAQAGHQVELYEQGPTLGSGASGQSLGMLVPFGPHVRGQSAALQRASIALWPKLADQISAAAGIPLASWFRSWPWPQAGQGTFAYQLNLTTLFPTLHAALTASSVTIHLNTQITQLPPNTPTILTAGMGNAPLGVNGLVPDTAQSILVHTTQPLHTPIYTDSIYVIPTWNPHHVMVGSLSVPTGTTTPCPQVTQQLLAAAHRHLSSVQPQSSPPHRQGVRHTHRHFVLAHAWLGTRPSHTPKLPLIRQVNQNVIASAGLGRVGLGLAPLTAQQLLGQITI